MPSTGKIISMTERAVPRPRSAVRCRCCEDASPTPLCEDCAGHGSPPENDRERVHEAHRRAALDAARVHSRRQSDKIRYLEEDLDRLGRVLVELRRQHPPVPDERQPKTCGQCKTRWPCQAIKTIERDRRTRDLLARREAADDQARRRQEARDRLTDALYQRDVNAPRGDLRPHRPRS